MGKPKTCSHKIKDCKRNSEDLWVVCCKDCAQEYGSGFKLKKDAVKALNKNKKEV